MPRGGEVGFGEALGDRRRGEKSGACDEEGDGRFTLSFSFL